MAREASHKSIVKYSEEFRLFTKKVLQSVHVHCKQIPPYNLIKRYFWNFLNSYFLEQS